MPTDQITSSANPRYRHARSLLRRKGRTQLKQVLLEGLRLIQDSMSAGYPPALFFYTRRSQARALPLIEQVRARGGVALCLSPELMSGLTATVSSQQMVAVVSVPQLPVGERGLHLVVDSLRDPGNMGTLLRSAAAADVDAVHCLPGVVDVWSPKVLRAGMGAHFRVAIRMARQMADLEAMPTGYRWYLAEADAPTLYTAVDWQLPSVLVVGGEANGPQLIADRRHLTPIAIPMARGVESLNAAVAASIILFEAMRQRGAPGA